MYCSSYNFTYSTCQLYDRTVIYSENNPNNNFDTTEEEDIREEDVEDYMNEKYGKSDHTFSFRPRKICRHKRDVRPALKSMNRLPESGCDSPSVQIRFVGLNSTLISPSITLP